MRNCLFLVNKGSPIALKWQKRFGWFSNLGEMLCPFKNISLKFYEEQTATELGADIAMDAARPPPSMEVSVTYGSSLAGV